MNPPGLFRPAARCVPLARASRRGILRHCPSSCRFAPVAPGGARHVDHAPLDLAAGCRRRYDVIPPTNAPASPHPAQPVLLSWPQDTSVPGSRYAVAKGEARALASTRAPLARRSLPGVLPVRTELSPGTARVACAEVSRPDRTCARSARAACSPTSRHLTRDPGEGEFFPSSARGGPRTNLSPVFVLYGGDARGETRGRAGRSVREAAA
jgi:hypothetical protein